MRTLNVTLPGHSYPIHMGEGILDEYLPREVLKTRCDRVVVITNDTIAGLYPGRIDRALEGTGLRVHTLEVPDGEQYKSLETLSGLYDGLMELQATRKTLALAFGGGVVGDMAGFCAATFMRGMPLVQVPTTLLSQVDSSVGGKTAVNHPRGKNTIGSFKQPEAVVMDLSLLATLPPRELRAGLFELIKHGCIQDDDLFGFLEQNSGQLSSNDWGFWEEAVYRSCRVKAAVVEQDEKEAGLRAILNFGHSLGHLIETHAGYGKVLHGEAVGVGMLFAAFVSLKLDCLREDAFGRISDLLRPLVVPVELPPLGRREFDELLLHDKKASGASLRFVLLRRPGEALLRDGVTPEELWPLFNEFLDRMPEVLRVAGG
ncbi:MAG: 3-dehydroquinate synthase [Deltaproteobacteria bacterium]|nr:3-dehydroquinate synthase [Deltaproteobacteria bacterium]